MLGPGVGSDAGGPASDGSVETGSAVATAGVSVLGSGPGRAGAGSGGAASDAVAGAGSAVAAAGLSGLAPGVGSADADWPTPAAEAGSGSPAEVSGASAGPAGLGSGTLSGWTWLAVDEGPPPGTSPDRSLAAASSAAPGSAASSAVGLLRRCRDAGVAGRGNRGVGRCGLLRAPAARPARPAPLDPARAPTPAAPTPSSSSLRPAADGERSARGRSRAHLTLGRSPIGRTWSSGEFKQLRPTIRNRTDERSPASGRSGSASRAPYPRIRVDHGRWCSRSRRCWSRSWPTAPRPRPASCAPPASPRPRGWPRPPRAGSRSAPIRAGGAPSTRRRAGRSSGSGSISSSAWTRPTHPARSTPGSRCRCSSPAGRRRPRGARSRIRGELVGPARAAGRLRRARRRTGRRVGRRPGADRPARARGRRRHAHRARPRPLRRARRRVRRAAWPPRCGPPTGRRWPPWTPSWPPSCWPPAGPPWQVLAAATAGLDWRGELLHSSAPFGVAYHVAVWTPGDRGRRRRSAAGRRGRADRHRQVRPGPGAGRRAGRRDRQRRRHAALPRPGHRHRQAHPDRAGGRAAPPARRARRHRDRVGRGLPAGGPRGHRAAAGRGPDPGAGRRLRAVRAGRARRAGVPRHRPGSCAPSWRPSWPSAARQRCTRGWPSSTRPRRPPCCPATGGGSCARWR